MTSLQHLCLLTSGYVTDDDASRHAFDIIGPMRQLKCLHLHYVNRTKQRVTWVRGPRDGVLFEDPSLLRVLLDGDVHWTRQAGQS
ncbi:hypothetical protein MTO96_037152 [Rhipicephalus appendiculatus]